MMQRLAIIVLGLLTTMSSVGSALGAERTEAAIENVVVGFDGTYKVGTWTAVRVTLAAARDQALRGKLRITVPDGDGIPTDYLFPMPEIPPGRRHTSWNYVKVGRVIASLKVQFEQAEGPHLEATNRGTKPLDALPSERYLVIELGEGFELQQAIKLRRSRNGVVHRSVTDADGLPNHLLGYAGVDLVFVVSSRYDLLDQLTDLQREAIESWVKLGGNLVVIASTESDERPSAPFADVLPGALDRIAVQRQTTGLEQFATATTRIDRGSSRAIAFEVPMAIISDIDGVVEVAEGFGADRRPAVVRGIVGFGQSLIVAFDVSKEPFASWPDRPRFLAALLDLVLTPEKVEGRQAVSDRGVSASLGFKDFAGQLCQALGQFEGVRLVPFSITATLIAVYILLVGPVDYWLLRRWDKSTWTWFTFVGTIVAFTSLAFCLTNIWKGNQIRINQATIVDVDLQRQLVRGTNWIHLFSPRTEYLDLDTKVISPIGDPAQTERVLSWHGMPGTGFGGMDSGLTSTTFSQPYRVDVQAVPASQARVSMREFPIAVWSSRSVINQWWGRCRLENGSRLEVVAEAQLQGEVVNPCPFELRDAYLMYDRWAYPLGNVRPGARVRLADRSVVDMQTRLTRRRVVDGRNVMTPWDINDTDIDRILELMMFYRAGQGRNYTNLTHQYHQSIDFSHHLKSGRAVLLGRSPEAAAEIILNGDEAPEQTRAHWTYYRLQMPVQAER